MSGQSAAAAHNVLYPIPGLPIGGAEQQLLELVRGLDKTLFHPIVATLRAGGPLEREFRDSPGVELIDLGSRGKWDLSPIWKLAKLIQARQVDVVQPYLPPTTSYGLLAGLIARAPATILTERSGARTRVYFHLRLQDTLARFADCVVANSQAGLESLVARGVPSAKILVVPNGINLERLHVDRTVAGGLRARLDVPEGGKVVGIVASLLPVKRHDVFLRAARLIGDRLPAVRFAIFGAGPLREQLEALVGQLELRDRVVLFGSQRPAANCLGACDLLVSSSQVEGLSNSVLEAMALRVPVVASDIPGNREVVQDRRTGYLVPVGDDRALAAAIEHAFTHSAETGRYVEQAHSLVVSQYSLTRMIETHQALYRSLTHARRDPIFATAA